MTRKIVSLFALISILILAGCSGSNSSNLLAPVTVHASPPPAPYSGCVTAPGKFGSALEYPGHQVSMVDVACTLIVPQPPETDTQRLDSCGKDQVVTQVLAQALHVHSIRLWIGAGVGSRFETGVCLEVIDPAGVPLQTFRAEWDKHIEEHYPDTAFPVDFIAPAGSTVRLSREPHAAISCLDGTGPQGIPDGKTPGTCLTQEGADLHGD